MNQVKQPTIERTADLRTNPGKQPTNTGALATLVIVFFFWGFIAASNSILIHKQYSWFEIKC